MQTLPTELNAIQLLLYLVQQEVAFLAASGQGSLGDRLLVFCCGLVKDMEYLVRRVGRYAIGSTLSITRLIMLWKGMGTYASMWETECPSE